MKNAIANNKSLVATALVALLGAASLAFMHVEPMSGQPEIVKLERVVINGKRAVAPQAVAIVQLPRVVVEGRRAEVAVQVAKAGACSTTAVC